MTTELSISKILLPVDFSVRSNEAVQYASRLARHFHSGVTLLHVLEPLHLDFAMVELPAALESLSRTRCAKARTRLDHFAAEDFDGIHVTRKVAQGPPAEEILAAAQGMDLVIMPTQGHGRIREFLIGSVTAKVLHDCERPVLTGVHLTGSPGLDAWQASRVLCAVDFGPESKNILRWAACLANEFGSAVSVIHVDSDPGTIHKLQQLVDASGLKAEVLVAPGEPHDVVADAAEQMGADLVIIGRGSSVGTLGRLRAQAYEIVRQSPCPVLSV